MMDCAVTSFIRGANPLWYFVNLDGVQFDDTYYMWVLENTVPYIPATVYHDPSGTIPWTDPIQFLPNGTLPLDIYFANNTIYRLEFRQAVGTNPPSQSDPLIYLAEDYNPSNHIDNPTNVEGDATENQVANAQFSIININSPLVLTGLNNPDPIEIAPGWFLDLVGAGNVTIERVALNDGVPTPTNAPYALRIETSGWPNQPVLRQRFSQNGQNWADKYVASSITARIVGSSQNVLLRLDASNGAPIADLGTYSLTNTFVQYERFALLGPSTNPNTPPNAYLELKLFLPTNGNVYVTSFQLIASDNEVSVPYQQDTIDRQVDHLFHYYKPELEYKPIPSYLIGWDFAYNPAQIYGDARGVQAIGANKSQYVWDQTIVFQSVDGGVSVTRNTDTGGLSLQAQDTPCQFAVIQYLEQAQARDILSGKAAVYINGSTTNGNGNSGVISLWATTDANLPDVGDGSNDSIVLTLDANGKPSTKNGTWTEVPRSQFGDASFTLGLTSTELKFNGWTLDGDAPTTTATYFAIVVGFAPFTQNDIVTFNKIALNKGDIATPPAPKTLSETTFDCQRYFWSTFPANTLPASAVGVNSGYPVVQRLLTGSGGTLMITTFPTTMRANPEVTYYNPVSANNFARNLTVPEDCTATIVFNASANRQKVLATSIQDNTGGSAFTNVYGVHITADARLGVVN